MRLSIIFADILTYLRIILSLFLIILILEGKSLKAAMLVIILALSDFLDGLLVKKFSQSQKKLRIGAIMDPFADKCLIIGGYSSLYFSGDYILPLWLFGFILFREICLILGWLYAFFFKKRIFLPTILGKLTITSLILALFLFLLKLPYKFYLFISLILVVLILFSLVDYFKKYLLFFKLGSESE